MIVFFLFLYHFINQINIILNINLCEFNIIFKLIEENKYEIEEDKII